MVTSWALSLARRRLRSVPRRASLVFCKVVDRLVDFVDRGLELFAGEVVVAGEAGFKGVQFLFKVGDVDAL